MSRNGKSKRGSSDRYVALKFSMMRTEAWMDLDTVARCAYTELARRYGGPGSNNGRIGFSMREMAERLNVSKPTAQRAFKRLQEHGFIVETQKGTFNYGQRLATTWRLTEFGCDVSNHLPSKEYLHWKKTQ